MDDNTFGPVCYFVSFSCCICSLLTIGFYFYDKKVDSLQAEQDYINQSNDEPNQSFRMTKYLESSIKVSGLPSEARRVL